MADVLAKQGSTSSLILPAPLPTRHFKVSLRNSTFTERSSKCINSDSSNPLIPLLHHFSDISFTKFFNSLNRRNSRIITAFLDNKAPLQSFLFKIGKSHSPSCTYCHSAPQDNIHILLHCPALTYARLSHLGTSPHILPGTPTDRDLVTPKRLLNFLINIPLFAEFASSDAFNCSVY